jgi:polygalacturonase
MPLRTLFVLLALATSQHAQPTLNIKEYGATGRRQDDARPALQKAIDAVGVAGGGTVYVPPVE